MFEVDNGISLCYACHIRKVHREDSSFALLSKIRSYIVKTSSNPEETQFKIETMIANYGVNSVEAVTEEALSRTKRKLISSLGVEEGFICRTCAHTKGAIVSSKLQSKKGLCFYCGKEASLFQETDLDWSQKMIL